VSADGKLTMKQRKLVQGVAVGKTQKQAAIDAGYSPKTAQSIASQELNKANVIVALTDLMDNMGLSDAALLIKHRELLNAQKQISGVKDKSGDPMAADAGSLEFVEVPDYPVQAKALEMAYKLKGKFVEKQEVKHSGEIISKIERTIVRPPAA
jgi:hypothetical protein